jgi:hypothetical protein
VKRREGKKRRGRRGRGRRGRTKTTKSQRGAALARLKLEAR